MPRFSTWRTRLALTSLLGLSGLAASVGGLPPAHADGPVVIDRIVAKINDDIITLNDLKRASGPQLLARNLSREQLERASNADEIYQQILDDMINTRLLVQEAKDLQLDVTEEDVDQWIGNVVRSENATEDQFRDELQARGVRWRDYRTFIKESLLKVRVVQVKVASRVNVTDAEVAQAYREKYGAPPGEGVKAVDLSHIHIPYPEEQTPEKMADVQALVARVMRDLDTGRPFADLAKEVGAGSTAQNGGYLGKFKPDGLRPEYAPVFDLEPGEYTTPIEIANGYHIFRVNEVFIERDQKIDARLEAIQTKLVGAQRERELKLWLDALRQRAYVKVMY